MEVKNLNELSDEELLEVFDNFSPIELHELLMSGDEKLLNRITQLLKERAHQV